MPYDDAMMPDVKTNREHLTQRQYASATNLAARQAIYEYQQPKVDLMDWVLSQVSWQGDERVVDVGCGNGLYLHSLRGRLTAANRPLGVDLSRGMLHDLTEAWPDTPTRPALIQADAQALPLVDGCIDVALAMHMLYHVPDIRRAAAELRRVLRPGGILLAATNSGQDKREIDDLLATAFERAGARPLPQRVNPTPRFRLENGTDDLGTAFAHIERRDLDRTLVLIEPAPLLRYLNSVRPEYEPLLPPPATWDDLLAEAETIIRGRIATDGAFRVRTLVGVFICR